MAHVPQPYKSGCTLKFSQVYKNVPPPLSLICIPYIILPSIWKGADSTCMCFNITIKMVITCTLIGLYTHFVIIQKFIYF